MQSRDATDEFRDHSSPVGLPPIPENEDVTAKVTHENAQEPAGFVLLDVLEMELEVEVEAPTLGTDRYAGDDRDPIASVEVVHYRRLADRGPTPSNGGSQ